VSAIVHALESYGVRVRDISMPATPYKIWALIQDAKRAKSGSRA
jgi:hypothetical protein